MTPDGSSNAVDLQQLQNAQLEIFEFKGKLLFYIKFSLLIVGFLISIPLKKEEDKIKEKQFMVGKIQIVHSKEFHDDDNIV